MQVLIAARPLGRYDIRFAASKGVLMTTCDSIIELDKIAKWHPNAQCVLTTTPLLRGMQVLTTTPDPLPSPQVRSSRTLRPRTSSSCMSGCGERMRPWSTSRTSSRLRLPSQPAWSR